MTGEGTAHQFTLRQLQIFWTVAQTGSFTRAAKQLDVRQPSISQQLSRMEHTVGGKLLRFANSELQLTPAGEYLLEEAGAILGSVDRASAGLADFFGGSRGQLKVGALPSLSRNLLMPAFALLRQRHPGYVLDVLDVTPGEAMEQLHGRILDAAVVSGYAAGRPTNLRSIPLVSDRQLLAVPRTMPDLGAVTDPVRDLSAEDLATLRRTVRYAFGSDHTARVNAWYEALVPGAERALRCRSYETAAAFVEGGLATALVPELAVRQGARPLYDVTLYEMPLEPRRTVLVIPAHNARLPSLSMLESALKDVAGKMAAFPVRPAPPFVLHAGSASLVPEPDAAAP